jgi:methionyl-tRNA synthetase
MERISRRNNGELADILVILSIELSHFAFKHFEGIVPEAKNLESIDKEMLSTLENFPLKSANNRKV